jgi:DNA-binding NtrC family response regulator
MIDSNETVLIVDDDADFAEALAGALEREFNVVTARSLAAARRCLENPFSAVLLDIRLNPADPANQDGLVLLDDLHKNQPDLPVIIMTSHADVDIAVEAMRLGAWDFMQKASMDNRELRKAIRNQLKRAEERRELYQAREMTRRLDEWDMVGDDPSMEEVRKRIDMVADDGDASVLITGETGTGKELVAKAIHERGRRKSGKLVDVAIASLPTGLVESALFGHVRGAFTDAREARIGLIEEANGGVLFLDEIGELTPDIQVKLLRFLETRVFSPLGSTKQVQVDTQVLCATNRRLEDEIKAGRFREDLYYRVRTMEIALPPLRSRTNDIPLLVDHFLSQFRQLKRTKIVGITPSALERLEQYSYPGNVRELKTIIYRAVLVANSRSHSMIELRDLELGDSASDAAKSQSAVDLGENGVNLDEELARVEMAYIQEALRSTEGRKTEAWRLLGLNDRFTLRRRIMRIGESYAHLIESFPLVKKLYYE